MKYKSIDEFVASLGVEDDIKTAYIRLQYGRENANQFGEPQRLLEGEGVGQHPRGGASPLLGESNQAVGPQQLNSLAKFIRNKPGGFTIKIDGKVPSKGFAVSPNKSAEMIVEKVIPENLNEFISKNIDQLSQDGYHLGFFGCLVWLALANTLRTESLEYDERQIETIKTVLAI